MLDADSWIVKRIIDKSMKHTDVQYDADLEERSVRMIIS